MPIELFNPQTHLVIAVGIATFFFGFGGGALLNLYLLKIKSPLVEKLRGSLDFKSSIFGDGILLPIINMIAISSILHANQQNPIQQPEFAVAIVLAVGITIYFHVVQALRGLVNWSMPKPWHWNLLGLWHAAYMLSVSTLLCLFYVVLIVAIAKHEAMIVDGIVVTLGLVAFFVLLRLDYETVSWSSLLPKWR